MIKKITKNKALLAFLLSMLLGIIIILPNIIKGKGIFALIGDFNYQQIPFNMLVNSSIKNGSVLWTWFNNLGSNFIGTFSFYNLFSPFNIIGYLFPAKWFPYLIGPIFILKYAVAGFTSYLFLKRYVKNKNYAVLGSLLYAFSGFQLTNMLFYHFHDVVAFFPLLLYSLDNLVYDNKKGRFALAVFLNVITNWFFFIGEVIFIVIYFMVKVITKSYKINKKIFFSIFIESLLGTLMSMFVLLPSYLFTVSNPRLNTFSSLQDALKYNGKNYLELVRAFIFPSDNMSYRSFLNKSNFKSQEIYLPVVGILLSSTFFLKKPKHWSSILMLICGIFMVIPILNSTFYLFNRVPYARWFYMPSLILSLMSIKCLEEKQNTNVGLVTTILGYIVFILLFFYFSKDGNIIYYKRFFIIICAFAIINLIASVIISKIKNEKKQIPLFILAIFGFILLFGNYNVYRYKLHNLDISPYKYFLTENDLLKKYKNVRTNSSKTCVQNLGYTNYINNIKTFNSNSNGSAFEFYMSINYKSIVHIKIDVKDKKTNDFLGVKYIIACNDEDLSEYGYTYVESNEKYKIYYNDDYKEFGFTPSKYMNMSDYKSLKDDEKKEALNDYIILNEDQIKKYSDLYSNKNNEYKINSFEMINNGFNSSITSSEETLAIYQVPYDDGWKAYVNDKETNIEKVDNGFMAIKINKGTNNIKFKYFTPGLKLGILVSMISFIIYLTYITIVYKKNCN